jgi:hypothetical protein
MLISENLQVLCGTLKCDWWLRISNTSIIMSAIVRLVLQFNFYMGSVEAWKLWTAMTDCFLVTNTNTPSNKQKGSTEKLSCCSVLVEAGENCHLVCGLKLDQRGFLCLEGLHQLIIDVCKVSLSSYLRTLSKEILSYQWENILIEWLIWNAGDPGWVPIQEDVMYWIT